MMSFLHGESVQRAIEVDRRGGFSPSTVSECLRSCLRCVARLPVSVWPPPGFCGVVSLGSNETALWLAPAGYILASKTLGTKEAGGVRFSVLPSRAPPRMSTVQFGRASLHAYPTANMTREYNAA